MSEYWKSTPKYWCKYCKAFVRDTKLEKANHEATPRHEGNVKRFLRELHKGSEREEREKQRAKSEVDRLNGVVSGSSSRLGGAPWDRTAAVSQKSNGPRQATPADRKKQLEQLAEMGVAVPEDFRKEMAMVGDWQTTSQRFIYDEVKKEDDTEDVKPTGLNIGVRKRKFEGQEEEEEAEESDVRKGWGSTIRTYPGTNADDEDDLDSLLKSTKAPPTDNARIEDHEPTSSTGQIDRQQGPKNALSTASELPIKQEEPEDPKTPADSSKDQHDNGLVSIKQEETPLDSTVIFKKRKAKPLRQKG